MQNRNGDAMPETVLTYLRSGRKIDAIKEQRANTGMGLKDAKEAVEAYISGNPSELPDQTRSSGKGMSDVFKVGLVLVLGVLVFLVLTYL